ncbi:MAG: EthD domain-containing protein [Acidimicrobiia bacterium]
MIKLICFVARQPSLAIDEFQERWRTEHAPKVAAHPATQSRLVRYELNRRKARDYERTDVPYDGVAVQCYSSFDDFVAMLGDPDYAALMEAESDLIDIDASLVLFTEPERVIMEGPSPRPEGLTKLFAAIHRRPGSTVEEFREHWRTKHAAVNRDTPSIARHILRYEQNVAQDGAAFDGVTIQWFENAREFFAMATEPEYSTVVEPDEAELLDQSALTWILTDAEIPIV